jgi:hypothetical protein
LKGEDDVNKKWMRFTAIALSAALALAGPVCAAVIEAEPDLQHVMGDLYTLSVAMRLYYDDTHTTQCPPPDLLEPYLRKPLSDSWAETYRTAAVEGAWWVGCQVPEFSRARKFLRSNASALGLYGKDSMAAWLGESFVWIRAVAFGDGGRPVGDPRVVQGEDGQRLFFNSPGTDYYWWSDLLFTAEARVAALSKFGTAGKGPFAIPLMPQASSETFIASPVSPPPDFTVERDEDEIQPANLGGLIFNPIPRSQD